VLVPDGRNASEVNRIALERFNLALGVGLGKLSGKVFRIGHLGHFNELALAATLSGAEMALAQACVPIKRGGVDAALSVLEL
jgi:alanine-glyoxylate transaminase/serine-glyoxylate transaminase/serine-pyruvate transaminase